MIPLIIKMVLGIGGIMTSVQSTRVVGHSEQVVDRRMRELVLVTHYEPIQIEVQQREFNMLRYLPAIVLFVDKSL